ncbi:uncharacterized protein EDB91DRAFT_1228182 [Suillus paluster]|uniref:uncharacterized protein n=1 Tax=Suillus paluster TaxID=48578 RepID=UPI001B88731D|nr:uncharacterized protein EDB91DRAFT_1228182 [Suillus paluster]KAG1728838.1 hypothetical protein EDB91DRAFT_1228182 [Suillus paluster]
MFRSSEILRVFGPSALAISILLNILTILHLQHTAVDVRKYTYIDDDHPTELPLRLDTVALTFNSTEHYSTSGLMAWLEWNSLDHFPRGHGFVRLGPNGRAFGVSMFHQIHCLQMIREALINGPDDHSGHCLNFLRQAILCNSDTTLDPLFVDPDGTMTRTDGLGVTHVCRDWTQVYAYIVENQKGPLWAEQNN